MGREANKSYLGLQFTGQHLDSLPDHRSRAVLGVLMPMNRHGLALEGGIFKGLAKFFLIRGGTYFGLDNQLLPRQYRQNSPQLQLRCTVTLAVSID